MNISYNWLNELISTGLSAEETAAALTRVGLAVEGIHSHGDDLVFDIDITSNRPDCLSHLGVARELAAITGKPMKAAADSSEPLPEIPMPAVLAGDIVQIQDPDLCHRFTARIIRNVKIGPSPKWLVDRLEAIGERSINNVADITNYVMHELGQPMHAFDLDKLAENRIVVRRARQGEVLKTLDEVERKLDETMLAICDAEKPAAVGGVMGGFDSGITDETVNVLLEVAYFDRENIRQTSRKLNLATEASYRFERGVDINNLKRASDRAADLISELAGGTKSDYIDIFPSANGEKRVESRDISAAVERLTGLTVETDECIRILGALGIESSGEDAGDGLRSFSVPTWRHDIAIEEDLVEEIARHTGYELISTELPPAYGAGEFQPLEPRKKLIRYSLAELGFDEALTYSFIDTEHDGIFGTVPNIAESVEKNGLVTLRDSVIEGAVRMRPTLLPGLLDAVRLNFNHQRRDVMLFEIGKAFAAASGENELPNERELLAIVVTGSEMHEGRGARGRELDFYDAKGALETALAAAGIENFQFAAADGVHLRSGQSAVVSVDGKAVGALGRLNEEISADYKFKQPVYVAEIDLQEVLAAPVQPVVYKALPKYPSVVRDVSLLVKRSLGFASIKDAIDKSNSALLTNVEFVDIYEGKGMETDERSITIRLEYRSDDRTLVESEADSAHEDLIGSLENSLGVRRRF